jgi:hypothetical protein
MININKIYLEMNEIIYIEGIYFLVKAFGKIKKLIKKYDVQIIYSNTTAVIIDLGDPALLTSF